MRNKPTQKELLAAKIAAEEAVRAPKKKKSKKKVSKAD